MFRIPNKVSDFLTIIACKSLPVIADLITSIEQIVDS